MDEFDEYDDRGDQEAPPLEEPQRQPLLHGKILLWMILVPGLMILLMLALPLHRIPFAASLGQLVSLLFFLCAVLMGLGIFLLYAGYFRVLDPGGERKED